MVLWRCLTSKHFWWTCNDFFLRPSSIRNNIFSGKLHHPTSHLTCPNPAICRLYHGSQESGVQNELKDGWVLLGHLTSSNTCNLNETEFHRTYTAAATWCRMTPACNGSRSKHNVWGLKHDVWWCLMKSPYLSCLNHMTYHKNSLFCLVKSPWNQIYISVLT